MVFPGSLALGAGGFDMADIGGDFQLRSGRIVPACIVSKILRLSESKRTVGF